MFQIMTPHPSLGELIESMVLQQVGAQTLNVLSEAKKIDLRAATSEWQPASSKTQRLALSFLLSFIH